HLVVSRDCRTLGDSRRGLWDAETGRSIELHPQAGPIWAVAFSPDGTMVATAHENSTYEASFWLWEAATLTRLRPLLPNKGSGGGIDSLAFSPNGQVLAASGADQMVTLLGVSSGRELARLAGHAAWVVSLAFAPDGRALASGSGDGTVIVWDI